MTTPSRSDGSVEITEWTSYTPTISATTTAPTLATTKTLIARYKVVGKSLHLAFTYFAAGTAGVNAGSGTYLFNLPNGFTINTSVAPPPSSLTAQYTCATGSTVGAGFVNSGSFITVVTATVATDTQLILVADANVSPIASGSYSIGASNMLIKFTAEIPIL